MNDGPRPTPHTSGFCGNRCRNASLFARMQKLPGRQLPLVFTALHPQIGFPIDFVQLLRAPLSRIEPIAKSLFELLVGRRRRHPKDSRAAAWTGCSCFFPTRISMRALAPSPSAQGCGANGVSIGGKASTPDRDCHGPENDSPRNSHDFTAMQPDDAVLHEHKRINRDNKRKQQYASLLTGGGQLLFSAH
jgi:hypothetical protein